MVPISGKPKTVLQKTAKAHNITEDARGPTKKLK